MVIPLQSGQRPAWLDAKTHKAPCSANVSYLMARIKHRRTVQIRGGFPPHAKLKQPPSGFVRRKTPEPVIDSYSLMVWMEWSLWCQQNISNTGQCWLVECLSGFHSTYPIAIHQLGWRPAVVLLFDLNWSVQWPKHLIWGIVIQQPLSNATIA